MKLAATKDVADPAALPLMLIGHVPLAPVPVGLGISVPIAKPRFVLAADAVDAFVPPLEIGTGEFNCVGGTPPEESRLLAKFAKFIAWVIVCLSALLFQILGFQVLFAYQQTTLSCLACNQHRLAYPYPTHQHHLKMKQKLRQSF